MADEIAIPNRFVLTITVSAIFLIGGLLVATGKTLSTIDQLRDTQQQVKTDIRELRQYIDAKAADRYTAGDAGRDLTAINQRLERIERQLDAGHRNEQE